MTDKPWWWPRLVDGDYLERLRGDYPDSADLSDEELRQEFECQGKYATTWDHLGDAMAQFKEVADRMLELEAIVAKLPKDANGVSVIPVQATKVYRILRRGGIQESYGWDSAGPTFRAYDDGEPTYGLVAMACDLCYSTRGAAEAAMAKVKP